MKREEAINVIRVNYPNVAISGSELETALRELIPELRKSEDESALEYIHELISFGYSGKFMDAQTAADMRKWVNEHLRPSWKPVEQLGAPIPGAVHDDSGPRYLELDPALFEARLKDFPDGAKVDVYIVERKEGRE